MSLRRRLDRLTAAKELAELTGQRLRAFCERMSPLLAALEKEEAALRLGLRGQPPAGDAWAAQLERTLPGEEGRTAAVLFRRLGRESLESALRLAEETAAWYARRLDRLAPETEKQAALSARLGFAGGLMLLLLLA